MIFRFILYFTFDILKNNNKTMKGCSVCLEESEILIYSKCNHFVCITCCWILRNLMNDTKCPICRDNLIWVI